MPYRKHLGSFRWGVFGWLLVYVCAAAKELGPNQSLQSAVLAVPSPCVVCEASSLPLGAVVQSGISLWVIFFISCRTSFQYFLIVGQSHQICAIVPVALHPSPALRGFLWLKFTYFIWRCVPPCQALVVHLNHFSIYRRTMCIIILSIVSLLHRDPSSFSHFLMYSGTSRSSLSDSILYIRAVLFFYFFLRQSRFSDL